MVENQREAAAAASSRPIALPAEVPVTGRLVWIAFALGLASAIPGMVLGVFGVPLGVAAAAVSVVALLRLTDTPPEQRRGEMLTLLSLGFGTFQVVFALVAFYFVNAT
jgi:hypothetical protein